MSLISVHQVDAILPQTQCGLCGYPLGCLPYAEAMLAGEAINLCVPGGQPVTDALATLLNRPSLPAEPSVWEIQADGRPQRMKAVIREDECIGCTKCIDACPVDAIIGTGKMMHSIVADLCTGCELCIAPCPVDCIDLVADLRPLPTAEQRIAEQNDLRQRYQAHVQREHHRQQQRVSQRPTVKAQASQQQIAQLLGENSSQPVAHRVLEQGKNTIELARIRSQINKLNKQLSIRFDEQKQQQLATLQQQLATLQQSE